MPFLEIRGVDGKNVTALTAEEAKEVRRRLDEAGLAVWSMGSPIGKIGIRDPFGPHLDLFHHTLDLADILGAKAFRLFSFYIPAGEDPEIYRDEVLEKMERFAEAGKGSGILLCSLAPAYWFVLPFLLVAGFGEGICEGIATPFVQDLHRDEPERYGSIAHSFWSVGIGAAVVLAGGLLSLGVSWRVVLGIAGLLAIGIPLHGF